MPLSDSNLSHSNIKEIVNLCDTKGNKDPKVFMLLFAKKLMTIRPFGYVQSIHSSETD